jgi:hypothetical protein
MNLPKEDNYSAEITMPAPSPPPYKCDFLAQNYVLFNQRKVWLEKRESPYLNIK